MKITDLEIGQFATRNWYNNIESLCVKRYNLNKYEYWEDGQFSSVASDNSLIFNYNDFKLCDCNGKLIEEFTYPLYMESIGDNSVTDRVVKFVSLTEGTVIIQGNSITLPSHRSTSWIKHMNTKHWKPYDFSKAPEIEDLDFWDARYNAGLQVYFSFDSNNNDKLYKLFDAPSIAFYKDIKFHISGESKPEFTYPMYFESVEKNKDKQFIVKFTNNCKGKIVKVSNKSTRKVGFVSADWISHNNTEDWKQVNFDETIGKIIPDEDDIDELISDLKFIIPSEYGAGTQLKESGYDQCYDLIYEWMEKYHITKAPDINGEKHFQYCDDLYDVIAYFKELLNEEKHKQNVDSLFGQNPFDEYVPNTEPSQYYLGIDYASQPDISFVSNKKDKSRLHNDALYALSYVIPTFTETITGATENVVKTNYNKTKEFTMNNELKEAILELIATNKQPKVKKPKTPKIVCNVDGTLMEFADEAALKSFMWSSRVESVIRYDLAGKVTVPFELSVEAPKTKASK